MNEAEAIEHYRKRVRELKKRDPFRPSMHTPVDVQSAQKFLAWCKEHAVDPKAMMDLRIDNLWRTKRAMPRFNQLRSEALLPFAQRQEASDAAMATMDTIGRFDAAVRDLALVNPTHDMVRRRYVFALQTALCVENPMAGGYDPRSHYCPRCPNAGECHQRMQRKWGFDVTALRAGQLELLPDPVRRALRGWDGRVSV